MKDKFNNAVGPQVKAKRKIGQSKLFLFFTFSVVAGLQVSTQYFAYIFEYQEALGWSLGKYYAPWSIISWGQAWGSEYQQDFMAASGIGTVVTVVGLLVLAFTKIIIENSAKSNPFLHGSARWANKKDIIEAGLLPKPLTFSEKLKGVKQKSRDGVYVGAWKDKSGRFHYLRHSGPEHVLTYAPTRSGKGVGLVVPTLLSWPHSALITDLKGELWQLTAGWRQKYAKNKVIRFEPAAQNVGAAWNPLDEIRIGTDAEVGDAQNLATLIVDPDGKGLISHWQKTSQALLVGMILHVLYKARNGDIKLASLPIVDSILADPNRDVAELWIEMTTYEHAGSVHPVVAMSARDMMDRPEEEAGSVLSTAKSYLSLFRDPVVSENVSQSDFRIKDLMNYDDPVSLYIITQPNDKARLRPLVRILLNMSVRLLADKMEFERTTNDMPVWKLFLAKFGLVKEEKSFVKTKKTYKHKLLGMIDEFPSLGKLEILQESLAFVAGYGIKFYLICQDLNQLKSRETGYGPDETITSNCHVQNAYPPNRVETAEHLSKLTGQTTVTKDNVTVSGKRASALLSNVSKTSTEVQRSLLTVDECLRMPGPKKNAEGMIDEAGDMVIYVAGFPAIYGSQPLYFKDDIFSARACVDAPDKTDITRKVKKVSEEIKL